MGPVTSRRIVVSPSSLRAITVAPSVRRVSPQSADHPSAVVKCGGGVDGCSRDGPSDGTCFVRDCGGVLLLLSPIAAGLLFVFFLFFSLSCR